MKTSVKKILFHNKYAALIFYSLLYAYRRRFGSKYVANGLETFSQDSEDLIILDLFENQLPTHPKVYLDIGANDPVLLSNTYLLYKNGWTGVAVEPISALAKAHRRIRPKAAILNAGIAPSSGSSNFTETIPHVYSSFDETSAHGFVQQGLATINRTYSIPILSFHDLLKNHPVLEQCSALFLDTEGYDEVILSSVPFETWKPAVVISEQGDTTRAGEILRAQNYGVFRRTSTNTIFIRNDITL